MYALIPRRLRNALLIAALAFLATFAAVAIPLRYLIGDNPAGVVALVPAIVVGAWVLRYRLNRR